MPANKLLSIENTDAATSEYWAKEVGQKAVDAVAPVGPGKDVQFIPFLWADTAEQALMNKLKELFLQLGEELRDVPVTGLPQRVADIAMQGQVHKSWWHSAPITPEARSAIEAVSATGGKEQYTLAHLLEPFPQAQYQYEAGTEVWDTQRLARAWGTVRLAVRAAQRTAAKAMEG